VYGPPCVTAGATAWAAPWYTGCFAVRLSGNTLLTYRLIALDLDGTALDSSKRFRPATRDALESARSRGIRTILVTGRHHRMAEAYHRELGLDTPLIACNGASVHDVGAGRTILERPLDRATAGAILDIVRGHEVGCHVYTGAAVHYERHDDSGVAYIGTRGPEARAMLAAFERVETFEALIAGGRGILKFVMFNNDRCRVERCLEEVARLPGLSCEWSWAIGADVALEGNTKGRTLVDWAASAGIGADEIIAFGDNHNDITMLSAAGMGVAMGNAEPEVKAAADWVAGHHDTDAIADALRRFVS
jgi:Cof subfamily protein (haloacid dehalogenase superfamily)